MAMIFHMNYYYYCLDLMGMEQAEMEMGKMVLPLPSYF